MVSVRRQLMYIFAVSALQLIKYLGLKASSRPMRHIRLATFTYPPHLVNWFHRLVESPWYLLIFAEWTRITPPHSMLEIVHPLCEGVKSR